jgi:hypothetical protein
VLTLMTVYSDGGGNDAMRNQQTPKIRRAGAYIVKAAESRPSRVLAKSDGRMSTPSSADKRLAHALLNTKRS